MLLSELMQRYLGWCYGYYRDAQGEQTREAVNMQHALVPLQGYGTVALDEIDVDAVLQVRSSMIKRGLARTTINARMGRMRRFIRWCISKGYAAPGVLTIWQAVEPLKYGRSEARETHPVRSAPVDAVQSTLGYLSPTLRRMVRLQLATGMRSSELCAMRYDLIDMSRPVWIYTPAKHKTQHLGYERHVAILRENQRELRPLRKAGYVFVNQRGGTYNARTYREEIKRAIKRCGCADWTPHRLRHNAATRFAEKGGVHAAGLLLGHRDVRSTAAYTDRGAYDVLEAVDKMRE